MQSKNKLAITLDCVIVGLLKLNWMNEMEQTIIEKLIMLSPAIIVFVGIVAVVVYNEIKEKQ